MAVPFQPEFRRLLTIILLVSLLTLIPGGATAQAFGPGISVADLVGYRNPGFKMVNTPSGKVINRWAFDGAISLSSNDERKPGFHHQFFGLRRYIDLPKAARHTLEGQFNIELNAIQPLRYQSIQLGGVHEFALINNSCKRFFIRSGIQAGLNNWGISNAPNLRPWDQGDPILATDYWSTIHPFVNAGLGFRGAINLDPNTDCERPGKAKWLKLSVGLSLRNLISCSGTDCFIFSSPLPESEFSPGQEVNFSNLSRVDASIAYQDDNVNKTYMISARYYHHGARPNSNSGFMLSGRKELIKEKLNVRVSAGKQLGLDSWMFNLGLKYQHGDKLAYGFSLFFLKHPPETFIGVEGMFLPHVEIL